MNAYTDYERRLEMTDMITHHDRFTYKILKQLKEDKRLENYDLFRIYTNGREDKEDLCFYKDGEFYYIESRSTTFKMIESQLEGRLYEYLPGGDKLYENEVQRFIRRKSQEEFDNLDDEDKISVIKGKYLKEELDNLMDGLIETLKDLSKTLKEEN